MDANSSPEPQESVASKVTGSTSALSEQVTRFTIEEYCADLRRMLGHCRDRGVAVSDSLGYDVLAILGKKSDSMDAAAFELVLRVHGQLSGIIAPATPRSLAATEFSLRDGRALRTYLLVAFLIIAAMVGLIGYVTTLPLPDAVEGQKTAGDVASTKSAFDKRVLASMTLQPAVTNLPMPASVSITSGDSFAPPV